jgi:beta-lactamase regulating signal transducer with metallopeptidase domain
MTTLPLLREVLSPALVQALGYALLHSLWQGGVLALLLAGALPLLRRQRAEVRYAASAGALAGLVLVVGLTFGLYYQRAPVAESSAGVAASSMATTSLAAMPARPTAAVTAVAAKTVAPDEPLTWLRANARQLEAYLPLVVVAWLLGLVLMSGRLAGGLLYASRLRRAGTQALGAEWQQRLATLAHRAGVRRPVALLESARVAGPVVLGHLRPVILLPLGAVAGLSPALLEALLAHELAHIVRRDYLLNLGLAVAEVLFFYHPAVWFMANCLRAERENCCDDQAAALCGGDGLRVARALVALAELEAATAPTPRLALAAAGSGGRGGLLARVRRLALGRPQAPTMSERLLAGSLTLLGLLGLSTGVVLAARPTQTVPGQTAPAVSPADTTQRRVAGLPALPAVPPAPEAPAMSRQIEREVRVELADNEPPVRVRRQRLAGPRRGASTIVIEKDKKGRVVNLTVDGQRIETATDKKAKRTKPARTVEVVTVPGPASQPRFERLERLEVPEMPELPKMPERLEIPETRSLSFNLSTDALGNEALRAARRALAEAMSNPNLNDEQRQEMGRELRKLNKESLKMGTFGTSREFHFNLNGAAASHPPHPTYRLERNKRGYARMKVQKSGSVLPEEEADRAAAEADYDAARADANARRAELRARIAADEAELRALSGGSRPPAPPRAPRAPGAPQFPQGPQVPAPPAPPAAPNTVKLREALRKDGLIKNEKHFSFELTDDGGRVDGKALTPEQATRYRQLLKLPTTKIKGSKTAFNITVDER